MTINIKDTLMLDDNNEYVVVSKAFYNDKDYYYLTDKKNFNNIKICYQDADYLVESNDKEVNTKLLPLFLMDAKKEFNI